MPTTDRPGPIDWLGITIAAAVVSLACAMASAFEEGSFVRIKDMMAPELRPETLKPAEAAPLIVPDVLCGVLQLSVAEEGVAVFAAALASVIPNTGAKRTATSGRRAITLHPSRRARATNKYLMVPAISRCLLAKKYSDAALHNDPAQGH